MHSYTSLKQSEPSSWSFQWAVAPHWIVKSLAAYQISLGHKRGPWGGGDGVVGWKKKKGEGVKNTAFDSDTPDLDFLCISFVHGPVCSASMSQ